MKTVSELIGCKENCLYQREGQCTLDNVPEFCLRLNSKKACIYYVRRDENGAENKKGRDASPRKGFESYF